MLKEAHSDQPNDPIACLTNLGWVCFGHTWVEEFQCNTHSNFTRTYCSSQVNKPPPPDDILCAFWELELLGIVDKPEQRMTAEERAAVAEVSEMLEIRNGRYRIGIPWKEGEPKLTNNYEVALVRFKSQEKSLKRKGPEVMEAYNKVKRLHSSSAQICSCRTVVPASLSGGQRRQSYNKGTHGV